MKRQKRYKCFSIANRLALILTHFQLNHIHAFGFCLLVQFNSSFSETMSSMNKVHSKNAIEIE